MTVVDRDTKKPIRGAYVAVSRADPDDESRIEGPLDDPLGALPTDESGITRLHFLPSDERLFLNVIGRGWMWPYTNGSDAPLSEGRTP